MSKIESDHFKPTEYKAQRKITGPINLYICTVYYILCEFTRTVQHASHSRKIQRHEETFLRLERRQIGLSIGSFIIDELIRPQPKKVLCFLPFARLHLTIIMYMLYCKCIQSADLVFMFISSGESGTSPYLGPDRAQPVAHVFLKAQS